MSAEKERRMWQDPEATLSSVHVQRGSTFIDVGCGDGFFAIPAAKIVGKTGKVYCVDIDDTVIHRLRVKAEKIGLKNMILKIGEAEETVFCESCADTVFFGIVLHDFKDPARVIANAKRMLKPQGRLVNLDWKKESTELGPPRQIRFSQEEVTQLIEKIGFTLEISKEVGPYHYLMVARPH
ncbi:MAG: methyltransferase domain-containing protein [archaeon]